jgi:alpha-acetolactate decarboxylase
MQNTEKQFVVDEVKGLLNRLKLEVVNTNCDLAIDNLEDLNGQLTIMEGIIERIKSKVKACEVSDNGDLY